MGYGKFTLLALVVVFAFSLSIFAQIGLAVLEPCTTDADCYKGGSYFCTCSGSHLNGAPEKSYCLDGDDWYRNRYYCANNDGTGMKCRASASTSSNKAQYTCDNGNSVWNNAQETNCNDGKDDDYDGVTDCSDYGDCSAAANCATTTTTTTTSTTLACSPTTTYGNWQCDGGNTPNVYSYITRTKEVKTYTWDSATASCKVVSTDTTWGQQQCPSGQLCNNGVCTTTTTTSATTTTSPGAATITVTTPNGGETWRQKSTVTVTWTSTGTINYVYIDLLDSSGAVKVSNLVNVEGNPGTASWQIPEYVATGSYKVRVSTCTSKSYRNDCYENLKNVKDTSDGIFEIKSSACTDSDNGSDVNSKGTVTIDSSTYTDYCSGNSVVEYYCSSSQATTVSSSTQECASGSTCSDGRCIAQSTTTTTVPPYSGGCTDSDGGMDYFKKGVGVGIYAGAAAGYNAIYGQEPNPTSPKSTTNSYSTYHDHCASSTQLNEGFCDSNGKLAAIGHSCTYGCNDGVCLPAPSTTTTTSPKKTDGDKCTSPSECYANACTNGVCGTSGCPGNSRTCPDGTTVTCSNYKDTSTNTCRTDCYLPTCPSATTTTYYTPTTLACSSSYPSYCNTVDQCKNIGNNWCPTSGGGYCTRESCQYCQSGQAWNCYNDKDCKEIGKGNWCYPSGGGAGYCTTASCPIVGPPTTIQPSFCGNGICEYGETPDSCYSDCKRNVCPAVSYTDDLKRKCYAIGGTLVTPPPASGNYCPPQPTCSVCGNNICEIGETTASCSSDCRPVGGLACGDNRCEQGETSFSCPADCTQISFCGNIVCEPGEERSCPGDCKAIEPPPGFFCPAQSKEFSKPTWDPVSGFWCCTETGGKQVGACSGPVQGLDRAFLERCVKRSNLELYVYINPTSAEESLNAQSIKQATILGTGFSVLKDLGRVINCYEQKELCLKKGIKSYPTWIIYDIPYGRILEQQELGTLTSCSQFEGPGRGTGPVTPPSDIPPFIFMTDPIEFLSGEALRHIRAELPPAFIDSVCKNPDDIKEEVKRRTLYELSVRGSITDMCTELQRGAAQCDREIEFRCQDMKKRADEFCSGREECRPFVPTDSMIEACKSTGGSFVIEQDSTGCANIPRCKQIPISTSATGAFVLRNGQVLNIVTGLQTAGERIVDDPRVVDDFYNGNRENLCSTFREKARFVCNELPRQCKFVRERAANCNPDKFKPELIAEKVADRVADELCKFKDFKTKKDVSQATTLPVVLSSEKKLTSEQISKVRVLTTKFDDAPLNLAGVYIYRGAVAANRLGDLRRLEFLTDVDVDHVGLSSAPAERGDELKGFVGKLEAMKELEKIPTALQPRVSESQSEILEVSEDVEEIQNKSKDFGYVIQQFFGMVAEQEKKDSALLRERADKLREIATNLQLISDSVGNVDARASLSEQITFLKEEADRYDKDAQAKESWSGGILSFFSQYFSGSTTTTLLPA